MNPRSGHGAAAPAAFPGVVGARDARRVRATAGRRPSLALRLFECAGAPDASQFAAPTPGQARRRRSNDYDETRKNQE
ncbi:exported hypothetical protein [Mesorhizobium metallidurans STM 2683]|uniref:Uncharacterized protein n=1 Tax=Mesorhizobium metallidurans STM 2683 TaxID=1297569 RepID=M5ENP7_9HYPH|nr:exported hypothetical protein [Mesorhizobium metallidurans STM 2683]